jgi:16S rRNA (cytidine1402-2'-O)-methyltransferase
MSGKLFIIGTPIGNLADLSPRAVEAIRSCSLLLCEDTRHTRKLLGHLALSVPLQSFHEHNEDEAAEGLVERLRRGETLGLVSDAGLPLLSDPGFALLRRLREVNEVSVEPIPGPFAAALALVASGLPPLPFTFWGFAPHREGDRRDFYRRIASSGMTATVYESPQRVVESLATAEEELGDVGMTLAREMTKMHEEFLHGRISEVRATLASRESILGEITLVFQAAAERASSAPDTERLRRDFAELRAQGLRRNDATKILADRYGLPKNELYKLLLGSD